MRLKEVRKSAGLTQKEVANFMGVNQNTYSYWENGKTRIDGESLVKLANLFGVTANYLLNGAPHKASIETFTQPKPAVRSDEEKLLGVYNSLDDDAKTQLMSVAYLIMANSLTSNGINISQLLEQQLHKIKDEGGGKND